MSYWWVSQNRTFEEEHAGGFLWAPERDKGGAVPHHWATMQRLALGDTVFCYVGQRIVAVAAVDTLPYRASRPFTSAAGQSWEDAGWRVDATYEFLEPPLTVSSLVSELRPLLPTLYSPLTETGGGNQGYLFALPSGAGEYLLARVTAAETTLNSTEAVVLPRADAVAIEEVWLGRKPPQKSDSLSQPRGLNRRSKRSKQIGDWAEDAVLAYLRRTLPSSVAESLRHPAAEGRFPGWDIEYIVGGSLMGVEVKGSTLAQIGAIEISANEWDAAQRMGERYCLAVVTRAESPSSKISMLWNPWAEMQKEAIVATPSVWRLERIAPSRRHS